MISAVFLSSFLFSATPQVGVVLVKRSGVSRATALARAELVRSALSTELTSGPVEDLTSCSSKLPCLTKTARARGWVMLLAIETASVLTEAIVDVRLLSIEEDGRELARANAQEPEPKLSQVLLERLSPVRTALRGEVAPATPPTPPPPPVEPPPPTPRAEVPPATTISSSPQAPPPSRPAVRWLPLGLSLGVTIAGAVFFGLAAGNADRLTNGALQPSEIAPLVSSGKTFEALGLGGLIGGGVASVASLILALAWPEAKVAPMVSVSPLRQATFGLVGVLP